MINFALPGLYSLYFLNKSFISIIENNGNSLKEGVKIASVYGCFPPAIWNGGRRISGFCSAERVREEITYFNSREISCRYTFTNTELTEKHLSDQYCNLLLEIANDKRNGVIVYSNVLEEYIRENFPNYEIISSTTKCIKTIDGFEDECQHAYNYVVLDYNLNHDSRLMSIRNPEKTEILVNAYCKDCCSERFLHYKALAESQLNCTEKVVFHPCPYSIDSFYSVMENRKSFVTAQEIFEKFYPVGIRNFKIEGRTNNIYDVLESYIYYLVRDECKDKVRLDVLRKLDDD